MAPGAQTSTDGWQPLIERLAVEAGERRAQNLIAEVNEKSPEFETLRRAATLAGGRGSREWVARRAARGRGQAGTRRGRDLVR